VNFAFQDSIEQELERLYRRRAAIEDLISTLEEYDRCSPVRAPARLISILRFRGALSSTAPEESKAG
jgi:hypothetical protein